MKFVFTWLLIILGILFVAGGFLGYFYFNETTVNDAKNCADVVADACNVASRSGTRAVGCGLIVLLGLASLYGSWHINK